MTPLRILFVSGSFPPMRCGVGDYTERLASTLADLGNRVGVLTGQQASAHRTIDVLPIAKRWMLPEAERLLRTCRAWRPDVVHFQFPTQGFGQRYLPYLLPMALRLRSVPIIETWHEYQSSFMPRYLPNAWIEGGLVAVRPNYRESMAPWMRGLVEHKEFRFIPNASVIPTVRLEAAARSALRARYSPKEKALVVYFGFVYPPKGVDLLFEIVDPDTDHLVLASDLSSNDAFTSQIAAAAKARPDGVTVAGFLPSGDLAALLAVADAVVLPFRDGGGMWNTSIHAAAAQGTFLLTTAKERHGFDEAANTYWARPGDTADLRSALRRHVGNRAEPSRNLDQEWAAIAATHLELYGSVIGAGR